ncbi:oxalate decarboxylase [Gymnopus androsaceus JB14]|uniref:Oxalate decarboxylase n=1 Tax=Gymnopus androsaceus JB14 TaxID=1447944 RepID=A0A6A4I2I9_9AGAR|nr:oxalate decarboxylase [Gymnopus androsaceus JB14]
MIQIRFSLILLAALAKIVASAPVSSDNPSATESQSYIPSSIKSAALSPSGTSTAPTLLPSPQRGTLGAPILGPDNIPMDLENADLFAPPTTDQRRYVSQFYYHPLSPAETFRRGNSKWPFTLSHNRLQTGGWARQENIEVMPIATAMASVNMRLEAGAIRELHWHTTSEWAYVLKGTTQVTAVNSDGQNFIGNVGPGDLWYFPPGIPHSLQATGDNPEGSEFSWYNPIFDDGAFSEDDTFLLTDWLAHVPAEGVISKNFQVDPEAFSHIPAQELYIFPGSAPPDNQQAPTSPQGTVPQSFTYSFSSLNATQLSGGSMKVVDSTNFPVATTISAAEVTVEPGAMRELHYHNMFWAKLMFAYREGTGRVTVFAAQSNARTFTYQAGDIGYVPIGMGHYVENTGNTTLRYLEVFAGDRVQDISLNQWLALTPPSLVKAHLNLDDETISNLKKVKPRVIGPSKA